MATLEDIARTLGVAKSTVSKALSGAPDVSEAMRHSVLETAVELGYSRLRRGEEAPKLAVFVTNMNYADPQDFGYDILVGFRKLAEPDGFRVDVIPLSQVLEQNIHYDAYMMKNNYRAGLFLGLSLDDPWLKEFESCRTPAVLYDNHISGNPRVTYVGADNREGLRLAVRHLQSLGHKKIGYLSSALGAYVYRQRYRCFREILLESGIPEEDILMRDSYHFHVCTNEYLPELLSCGCTAIVCSHDMLALAAMNYCRENGIRIPEDVSIIGFDDIPLCAHTTPPMTTIRQDRTQIGKSAYCALSSLLEGVHLSTFLLHTELIQRQSCAPPKCSP